MFRNKNQLVSFVVLCASILISFPIYNVKFYHLHSLASTKYCPSCFGQSMCKCLEGNFSFNWNYIWTNIINLCFGERIIYAICENKLVVIKKFSTPKTYINVHESTSLQNITSVIQLKKTSSEDNLGVQGKFQLCPSLYSAEKLYLQNKEKDSSSNIIPNDSTLYKNILHSIQVNIEPIIQQIGLANQWAVSEYLGSCGDTVFSKYCGEALTDVFPRLNWTERSSIAKQLLQFAFNATFQHPDFAFYFTDMTPDNFAVSSDIFVRLVDLDHVIIVDKNTIDQPPTWNEHHNSYHDPTEQGFAFSLREVCSHKTSDLNIYSICQGILSENTDLLNGGLLHSPPLQKQKIIELVQHCVSPPAGQSRFDIARTILKYLDAS